MGNKIVCISCKKVFNTGTDFAGHVPKSCGICGAKFILVNQKYKAPKLTDVKAWKLVEFLLENGFVYQHIVKVNGEQVPYPKTMDDAKEFVAKYKSQQINY
jgi:hypothetical protein